MIDLPTNFLMSSLQDEVDKLKVTLEHREVDNAALGAEVTRLKMFIADHCVQREKKEPRQGTMIKYYMKSQISLPWTF